MRPSSAAVILTVAVATVGCGHSTGTSGLGSMSPSTVVTETFSGSVPVGGGDNHQFVVSQDGQVSVNLLSLSPSSTSSMGLGIGTPSGTTCSFLANFTTTAAPGSGPQLTGTLSPGTYCAGVYDVGNAASTVTYTITVTHS